MMETKEFYLACIPFDNHNKQYVSWHQKDGNLLFLFIIIFYFKSLSFHKSVEYFRKKSFKKD